MHSNQLQQLPRITCCTSQRTFLDPICAVHLEMSRQFVASIFGIVVLIEICSKLYSIRLWTPFFMKYSLWLNQTVHLENSLEYITSLKCIVMTHNSSL